MKHIPLTQGKYAIVDNEDYDWLMTWNWYAVISKSQIKDSWRAYASSGQQCHLAMHRLLMIYPPGLEIDHINHNSLDNQKHNLRITTHRGNLSNKRYNKAKYTGVKKAVNPALTSIRWQSRIWFNGKREHLGMFDTEIEAHYAYQVRLNQIQSKANWAKARKYL